MDSFNYVISSDDRTNDIGQLTNFYEIDFGGFNTSSNRGDFNIEVVQCILNGNVLSSNGYIMLIVENLADNGVFCPQILDANQAIVAVISTNIDGLISNSNITFRANNCKMIKRIRFSLHKPDFNECVDDVDININGIESRWVLTLKMTPIKDE